MKNGFLSILGGIFGMIVFAVAAVWIIGAVINNHKLQISRAETTIRQRDSLQVQYNTLKQSYDSLVAVNLQNEQIYTRQQAIDKEKMKQYKTKIRTYEKAIDNIGSLTDAELISNITEFYRRTAGY